MFVYIGTPYPRISTQDGTSIVSHDESSKSSFQKSSGRRAGSPTHLKRQSPLRDLTYGVSGTSASESAAASSASGGRNAAAGRRFMEFTDASAHGSGCGASSGVGAAQSRAAARAAAPISMCFFIVFIISSQENDFTPWTLTRRGRGRMPKAKLTATKSSSPRSSLRQIRHKA